MKSRKKCHTIYQIEGLRVMPYLVLPPGIHRPAF
jgi:hypothetical protein